MTVSLGIDEKTLARLVAKEIEELMYNKHYAVWTIDLTKAHDNELIDLVQKLGTKAKAIYIQRADDTAYIKLNAIQNQSIEATPGLFLRFFYVSRIYVTNVASSVTDAKLVIIVFW